MLFNSYAFFILVIITLIFYYSRPLGSFQVVTLILASAVFYSYTQPVLLILLLVSASTNALCSYFILSSRNSGIQKLAATAGVIFNLAVLGSFKYSKFLVELFIGGETFDASPIGILIELPLPIGISFYTFQGISLLIDVYKGDYSVTSESGRGHRQHFKNTLLYIMFFPQLIAGPIVKARDFYPQILRKKFKDIDFYHAYKALVIGFFLKSVIADNLKDQTFWIADPYFTYQSSLTLVTMMVGYSFQIYADFAGYSLIAIGVAGLFGYKLPENFNFPYISRSITEFWRRWHISLSSWLKDYLYIDLLGGSRRGSVRTYFNLIVVMFLGGLWHGAALSYGIWGLWHGLGLAIERVLTSKAPGRLVLYVDNSGYKQLFSIVRIVYAFTFVTFGWLFFKLSEFSQALAFMKAIVENRNFSDNKIVIFNTAVYSLPVITYHFVYLARRSYANFRIAFGKVEVFIYSILLFAVLTNGGIPGEFVYFQF
jgi:alginate O-acetyltransferase complex protein AlgI